VMYREALSRVADSMASCCANTCAHADGLERASARRRLDCGIHAAAIVWVRA
jgi:hypothetical protein